MDCDEYRRRGKEMVDYIADYLENIRDRRVFPDVKPGYMRQLMPEDAPLEGEQWDTIFADIERVIMPGVTHWQSPHMHGYFPALNSFPSMLGDMLADAINCLGFTWASSPACTELEIIVMNWLGKMIGLPDEFLHLHGKSQGGGVIQTTASEATLVCLLAGRTKSIQRFHEKHPGLQDAEINARLVAYCSDQAHSSVEKAALIGLVRMRYIEVDEELSMRGQPLRDAIEHDIKQGLVPFWVCATLGTTGACAFDNLEEIGLVCREYNLWLHVDSAYAGSAFICPEFRTWLKGIQLSDSIAFNPSKWLMVHFDLTALWIKDSAAVHRTFNVEPLYLQHENSGVAVDFMHWQIPLSRRFRALKLWFVLRSYGIKGLQRHIREGVRLAQKFEALIRADHRFEIPAKRHLGLVVFRIKGDNEITEHLLKRLNHRGRLHCVPSSLKGKYVIRFTVTSTHTTTDDILKDWSEIRSVTTTILEEMNISISNRNKVCLKDTKDSSSAFGSSLLLSNSPLSPKIVNGSFAAIFDTDEFLSKTYAGIRIAHQESPSMRRRVRGILMSGKQFSLDSHMDVVVQTTLDSNTITNSTNTTTTTTNANNCYENSTIASNNCNANEPIQEDNEENIASEEFEVNRGVNNYILLENSTTTPTSPPTSIDISTNFLMDLSKKDATPNITTTTCTNSLKTPILNSKLTLNTESASKPSLTSNSPSFPSPSTTQLCYENPAFKDEIITINPFSPPNCCSCFSNPSPSSSSSSTTTQIYHGKRFLEPVDDDFLHNSVFQMLPSTDTQTLTYSAKAMFSDDLRSPSTSELDWQAILQPLKTAMTSSQTLSTSTEENVDELKNNFNETPQRNRSSTSSIDSQTPTSNIKSTTTTTSSPTSASTPTTPLQRILAATQSMQSDQSFASPTPSLHSSTCELLLLKNREEEESAESSDSLNDTFNTISKTSLKSSTSSTSSAASNDSN